MIEVQIFGLICAGIEVVLVLSIVVRIIYDEGVRRGRQLQLAENRKEIEDAIIGKAMAEQEAAAWARRARALLRVI